MKGLQLVIVLLLLSKATGQNLKDVSTSHLPEVVLNPFNSMDAKVADIDADGDLDIVVAVEFSKNVILLNDGQGRFLDGSKLLPDKAKSLDKSPYSYYPYHDSEDVALVDLDKNGWLDIVFVTEDDKKNEWYSQQSKSKFVDRSDKFPVTGVSNALIAADFDDDGWIDIIVGNNGQNNYLKNQAGELIDQTPDRLPLLADVTQDLEVADYDNDGDLDLLVGNEDDNKLYQNDGRGYFTDVTKSVFDSGISEETREADFADVDGDGDLDIYFANVMMFTKKNPAQRLLINDNGRFVDLSAERLMFSNLIGALDADFYDIDDDGDKDLLLGNLNGFAIGINDGNGFFKESTNQFVQNAPKPIIVDIEVADFNADGKPDIYLACFRGPDVLLMSQ